MISVSVLLDTFDSLKSTFHDFVDELSGQCFMRSKFMRSKCLTHDKCTFRTTKMQEVWPYRDF